MVRKRAFLSRLSHAKTFEMFSCGSLHLLYSFQWNVPGFDLESGSFLHCNCSGPASQPNKQSNSTTSSTFYLRHVKILVAIQDGIRCYDAGDNNLRKDFLNRTFVQSMATRTINKWLDIRDPMTRWLQTPVIFVGLIYDVKIGTWLPASACLEGLLPEYETTVIS